MFGKNVDKTKAKVRTGIENFLSKAFQKFHNAIFPMLMVESFLDQFIFIWGREQCSQTSSEISPMSDYY